MVDWMNGMDGEFLSLYMSSEVALKSDWVVWWTGFRKWYSEQFLQGNAMPHCQVSGRESGGVAKF